LAVGEGASIPLPEQGKVFWVHYEDGQVENRETSKEEVIEKASNVELELRAGEKGLLKRRIPLMACIRKLGNLYRRAWRNRCDSGGRGLVSGILGIDLRSRQRDGTGGVRGTDQPRTLKIMPLTLIPDPFTLNPKSSTLNSERGATDLDPQTFDSKS
jgi:hypothetical protein